MSTNHAQRSTPDRSGFITARRIGQGTWWEGRSGLIVPLIVAAFATYLLIGILTMDVAEDADKPGPQFFPTIVMIACYILAVLLAIAYIRHPDPVENSTDVAAPAAASASGGTADEDVTEGHRDGHPGPPGSVAGDAFRSPLSSAVAASRTEPGHADDTPHERTMAGEAARADAKHRTHSDFVSIAWGVGGFAVFAALIVPAGWIISAAMLFWAVARAMGSRRPLFDLTLALAFSSVVYLAFDTLLGLNLPSGFLGGNA